ncbi:hypothetical protein [Planctomicrobium piriforme]|uniref:Uncharacterized protein n=1 Tax=Planctomicrobium piriforme TaxID=1576369 RepID=A0A1I3Q017_9PLAN|nr:hypothetical protein [Planctomicrobium piriforme]SFJ26972.1 hypothetical protein SAMN05421753_11790 [Planctomicrobium piriforme]
MNEVALTAADASRMIRDRLLAKCLAFEQQHGAAAGRAFRAAVQDATNITTLKASAESMHVIPDMIRT